MSTVRVRLDGVTKVHGDRDAPVTALDGIDLTVTDGEFVCLVGASGCGKTTLLNLVAGLDQASAGTVAVNGKAALMFQESALFPWLTVSANVELPLRLQGVEKTERRERVRRLLDAVHLRDFAAMRPHELSGGMRQRAALARAFAQDAPILLMDEPFGALDAITRDLLHAELEALWRKSGLTVIFVTHNVREAVRLADRVILLSSRPGRVAAEFDVPIPHPRRMEDAPVAALAGVIADRLAEHVLVA